MSDETRFPVGKFAFSEPAQAVRKECIAQFREAPSQLRRAVDGLSRDQLASRYRTDGWTLAQVVHHLAESDANAYPRLKYALTESVPPSVMVAPQELWAELPDARGLDAVVFAVPHRAYRTLDVVAWLAGARPVLVDANAVLTVAQRGALAAAGCAVRAVGEG